MNTLIPTKLHKLIDKGQHSGGLRQTYELFTPLLGNYNSALFFFPEYTDHGPEHIAAVLRSTVELIPRSAWKHLTPEDGVIIALASLLHDIAMVLPSDSLLFLTSRHDLPRISELDHMKWPDLFDDFYLAARRWDEKKLARTLGDKDDELDPQDYVHDVVHINDRPDPETWSVRYRKFLGEFVRYHHARIAHEIARYGFPGSGQTLKIVGIPEELCDIAGLVARSHNLEMRSTFDYLKGKYDSYVECRNSHPVFSMALLRIADYLQIDANRVNSSWNTVQRLRSPISQMEWNAHLAVREIRQDDEDPESLFISAKPNTASTFIKTRNLLKGLQYELDTSWAVISEVFGRRQDLSGFGLTIRRVKSNLEDEQLFLRTQNPDYFPLAAAFDTSGASLLKLLIRPLYGDAPEIGIRELLQNSLDAVRERKVVCEMHPELRKRPLLRQRSDVLISLSKKPDGSHYLSICDKGIGMRASTIRDYFLKAGASFRRSDAWSREFQTNGVSTVVRSGRFGIGALAAFLLGDRIKVRTRYIRDRTEDGVAFEAGLNDESIELLREKVTTIGTSIEIRLRPDVALTLANNAENSFPYHSRSWDWYVLNDPVVSRRVFGKTIEQSLTIPTSTKTTTDHNWRSIYHKDYKEVLWSYMGRPYGGLKLACNGIRVSSGHSENTDYSWGEAVPQMPCRVPDVSVIDPDANLPLTLKRDSLEGETFPFASELADDVTKDFCAYLLLHSPRDHKPTRESSAYPLERRPTWHPFHSIGPLVATKHGTMLLHPWHIKKAKIRRVLASTFDLTKLRCFKELLTRISGWAVERPDAEDWLGQMLYYPSHSGVGLLFGSDRKPYFLRGLRLLVIDGGSIVIDRDRDDETTAVTLMEDLEATPLEGEGDYLLELGQLSAREDVDTVYDELNGREPGAFLELVFDPDHYSVPDSTFTKVWDTLMKDPVIPYDYSERARKFKQAFKALPEYLKLWDDPPSDSWRRSVLRGTSR